MCSQFFNVLDYTPKLLESTLMNSGDGNKKQGNNQVDRILKVNDMRSSNMFYQNVGQPRLFADVSNNYGCQQQLSYFGGDFQNEKEGDDEVQIAFNKKYSDSGFSSGALVQWNQNPQNNWYSNSLEKKIDTRLVSREMSGVMSYV